MLLSFFLCSTAAARAGWVFFCVCCRLENFLHSDVGNPLSKAKFPSVKGYFCSTLLSEIKSVLRNVQISKAAKSVDRASYSQINMISTASAVPLNPELIFIHEFRFGVFLSCRCVSCFNKLDYRRV